MADWKMNENGIICSIEGKVAIMKIDKPEMKNGTDWKAKKSMVDAYERIAADPDVSVLVMTGSGDYFITGGRVNAQDPEERKLYAEYLEKTEVSKKKIKVPIIAAVNGDCLKGGMGILAEADLAVAKRTAKFSFPEVRMGGVPMKVMARCMMTMPKKFALEAYYSCKEYDAETMYRIGMLNAVTDEEDFWPTVETYIHMITDHPKTLIQMTHDAYLAMAEIYNSKERISFAQKMLEEEVLPQMAKEKTTYNV